MLTDATTREAGMQPQAAALSQLDEFARPAALRLLGSRATVHVAEVQTERAWCDETNREEAMCHLARLERAVGAGRERRAARARRHLLSCIQRDRVAEAEQIARSAWLPLERVG